MRETVELRATMFKGPDGAWKFLLLSPFEPDPCTFALEFPVVELPHDGKLVTLKAHINRPEATDDP